MLSAIIFFGLAILAYATPIGVLAKFRTGRAMVLGMIFSYPTAAILLAESCQRAGMSGGETAALFFVMLLIALAAIVPWVPNFIGNPVWAERQWKKAFWAMALVAILASVIYWAAASSTPSKSYGGFLFVVEIIICSYVGANGASDRFVHRKGQRIQAVRESRR